MALLELNRGTLMEIVLYIFNGNYIENITKSHSNFVPTFVDHHSLPDMNFNGHCFFKKGISVPKKEINIYIPDTLGPQ